MTQYPATTPFERNPGVETQVSYTAQGHTQKESNVLESKEYEYNAAERLIRYVQKDETLAGQSAAQTEASYRYGPFGRRIAKTVKQGGQTKTTYDIYSEQGLMAEADEKGQMTKPMESTPKPCSWACGAPTRCGKPKRARRQPDGPKGAL